MTILDTRDLNKRLEELEAARDAYQEAKDAVDNADESDDLEELESALVDAEENFGEDEEEELHELEAMRDEIPEWSHGEALIPVGEWVEYVEDFLKDIGDLPRNIPWYIEIDWEATADNILADYSEVDYQGDTYYFRNC